MRNGAAIEVENLSKHYGNTKAVDDVSFGVQGATVFGILGPNGAGKTTTLEMVEGLRKPDSGSIKICGMHVWPNPKKIKGFIGAQLQSTSLFNFLNVQEIVRLFASFFKVNVSKKRLNSLLNDVGLSEKASAMVNELSGGQQQRLSIALALVNDPKIIFLDEPTTGLDPQARRRLWDVVQRIKSEGKTIVITTHYMEEAEILCDEIAIMDHGKIIALDKTQNLIDSLGADSKITFTSRVQLKVEEMEKLPDVKEAINFESSYSLFTGDVQSTILAVLNLAQERDSHIENLNIGGPNLEDLFLHLTGRGLRD